MTVPVRISLPWWYHASESSSGSWCAADVLNVSSWLIPQWMFPVCEDKAHKYKAVCSTQLESGGDCCCAGCLWQTCKTVVCWHAYEYFATHCWKWISECECKHASGNWVHERTTSFFGLSHDMTEITSLCCWNLSPTLHLWVLGTARWVTTSIGIYSTSICISYSLPHAFHYKTQ